MIKFFADGGKMAAENSNKNLISVSLGLHSLNFGKKTIVSLRACIIRSI